MLRTLGGQAVTVLRRSTGLTAKASVVRSSHHNAVSDEEFEDQYATYFSRIDIDSWELRKGMNDLMGMDMIPSPKIINAGLRACRRHNDFALAIRWLEGCKNKCASQVDTAYPYLIEQIRPTLDELGISTPEEMGYSKPELALKSVYDM